MRRRIVARMLPADIPQTDHLLELVEMRGIPSITISLPSSPVPADHERIRLQLRDLIDDADRQAKETSVGRPEREAAIARLRSVLDDDDFWTHQSRSLVLLASAERLETFRLANRLTARATVSDRFDTGPLLRAVTFPRRAFVVQISRGGARLTEFGADHGLAERDLAAPGLVEHDHVALAGGLHGGEVHRVAGDGDQVDGPGGERVGRVADAGEQQQVLHDPGEPPGAALHRGQRRAHDRGHLLGLEDLEVARDRGQGVLQLVGDRRDQLALVGVERPQLLHHGVLALEGPRVEHDPAEVLPDVEGRGPLGLGPLRVAGAPGQREVAEVGLPDPDRDEQQ